MTDRQTWQERERKKNKRGRERQKQTFRNMPETTYGKLMISELTPKLEDAKPLIIFS